MTAVPERYWKPPKRFIRNTANGGDKVDTFGSDGLDYNRFDAGWNIGLGVEFGKILVGLDTQLGFCKVKDGNAPHNANIGITLGYKF